MADIKKMAEARNKKMIELTHHPLATLEHDRPLLLVRTNLSSQYAPAVEVPQGFIHITSKQHEKWLSKPGVVMLVTLEMAATCVLKGTHDISTEDEIAANVIRERKQHEEMMKQEALIGIQSKLNVNIHTPASGSSGDNLEVNQLRAEVNELKDMLRMALGQLKQSADTPAQVPSSGRNRGRRAKSSATAVADNPGDPDSEGGE